MSPYIKTPGPGEHLFLGMNNISVCCLQPPLHADIKHSAPVCVALSSAIKTPDHQFTCGQRTLPEYIECILHHLAFKFTAAQLHTLTPQFERHTRSQCVGHVRVRDNISKDNLNQRGRCAHVCPGISPNLIWKGKLIRASHYEEAKSDHVCCSWVD